MLTRIETTQGIVHVTLELTPIGARRVADMLDEHGDQGGARLLGQAAEEAQAWWRRVYGLDEE